MFNLDTFRLIKKTFRRFLSLTLIVMIGSAFMMGLMSTSTLMRENVDEYNDKYNLQDIQIYSQYGFCYEDYQVLKKSEVIDKIFASKTLDLEVENKNKENRVARILEISKPINKIELSEGRMPVKTDECVVLCYDAIKNSFEIGDKIKVFKEDIDDYLRNDEYTIVGKVTSPDYISLTLGTSNYKNKDLSLVMYVLDHNFISEYYTTMYITLKDAEKYTSYSKQYKRFVEEKKDEITNIAYEQESFLKNRIYNEMEDKINQAQKEFDEKKQEGENELADASKKLDEANIQLVTYESQLNSLSMIINRLKNTINTILVSINSIFKSVYNH